MTIDFLIPLLLQALLALHLGVAIVLLLRRPVLRWLGARSAYLLWGLPLGMMVAVCLPISNGMIEVLPVIRVSARSVAAALMVPGLEAHSRLSTFLFALWLLGALIAAAILIHQQRRFVQSLGELQRRAVGWLCQVNSGGPALVGALRPRIVLPADFESRYDASERELILAHEAVHLQRGDAQINALVALLRCLNWFNPLIHYAASRFRFDQEVACDAVVIARFPESARAYAGAMLRTQLGGESRQELRLPVGCHWQSDHPLKERIMLLKKPIPTFAQRKLRTAAVAALIATASMTVWAAQTGTEPSESGPTTHPNGVSRTLNATPSENITFRSNSPPKYPAEAVKTLQSAKVVLKVEVDATGNPKSARVDTLTLVDSPDTMLSSEEGKKVLQQAFAKASIDAAMSWKFNPGLTNGKPTGGYLLVPVDYVICKDENDCHGDGTGKG
jgi:beta-lactamase regulating signal transducer with metallopeptidase domain